MCSSFENRVGWGVQLLVMYKRIWLFLETIPAERLCRAGWGWLQCRLQGAAVTSHCPRHPRAASLIPALLGWSPYRMFRSLKEELNTAGSVVASLFLGSGKVMAGVLLCSRFFVSGLQQGSRWEYISFLLINRQECQVTKGWSSNKITQTYPVVSCTGYSKIKKSSDVFAEIVNKGKFLNRSCY